MDAITLRSMQISPRDRSPGLARKYLQLLELWRCTEGLRHDLKLCSEESRPESCLSPLRYVFMGLSHANYDLHEIPNIRLISAEWYTRLAEFVSITFPLL